MFVVLHMFSPSTVQTHAVSVGLQWSADLSMAKPASAVIGSSHPVSSTGTNGWMGNTAVKMMQYGTFVSGLKIFQIHIHAVLMEAGSRQQMAAETKTQHLTSVISFMVTAVLST